MKKKEIEINIGTSIGNIQNVKVDKPFEELRYKDICDIVEKHYPNQKFTIIGWCLTPKS